MKKLRLTPAASITNNQNGVLLSSDLGDFQISGRDVGDFINRVVPMLDGRFDEHDVCLQLPDYDDDSIKAVLGLLTQHGLLEQVDPQQPFSPPGLMQERFLKPWRSSQLKAAEQGYKKDQYKQQQISPGQTDPESTQSSSDGFSLKDKKLLVIGLEPWSLKFLIELGTAGVGHIHLMDKELLTEDDVVCHRDLGEDNIGQSRLAVVAEFMAKQSPWTQFSHSELTAEKKQLVLDKTDFDLVVVTLGRDSVYWLRVFRLR